MGAAKRRLSAAEHYARLFDVPWRSRWPVQTCPMLIAVIACGDDGLGENRMARAAKTGASGSKATAGARREAATSASKITSPAAPKAVIPKASKAKATAAPATKTSNQGDAGPHQAGRDHVGAPGRSALGKPRRAEA